MIFSSRISIHFTFVIYSIYLSSISLISHYFPTGGYFRGLYAIFIAIIAQVLLMITEYWVRWWAGGTFFPEENVKNVWILGILTCFCIFIGFYR